MRGTMNVFKEAVEVFGIRKQRIKSIEEMSEAIVAMACMNLKDAEAEEDVKEYLDILEIISLAEHIKKKTKQMNGLGYVDLCLVTAVNNATNNMAEEIADVEILFEQIKTHENINRDVMQHKRAKAERLKNMLTKRRISDGQSALE